MKKLFILLSAFAAGIIFANGEVNVYSSRHYDVDNVLFQEFEKETGIKVNVTQNKDVNVLMKKLELEGKSTTADVFMTVGVGDLYTAKIKGLLQPVADKEILENVPSQFRDSDNYWVGMTYRARIIVYNPKKVKVEELSTYEDLANKKWKGRIVTRSSSSSYNQHLIAFMMAKNGDSAAQKWAIDLVKNFARTPSGNDRAQAKAVNAGLADIAIINSYYMGKMSVSKDPIENETARNLKIFFPNQNDGGTHINLSGAGIVKDAKNKENAIKLIEFLTSKKAQEILSNENFEYPVNKNAKVSDVVKSWGDFKASKINFDSIGKNLIKATFISGVANWK